MPQITSICTNQVIPMLLDKLGILCLYTEHHLNIKKQRQVIEVDSVAGLFPMLKSKKIKGTVTMIKSSRKIPNILLYT